MNESEGKVHSNGDRAKIFENVVTGNSCIVPLFSLYNYSVYV